MLNKISVCVLLCAIALVQCDVSHLIQQGSAFEGYNYPTPRSPFEYLPPQTTPRQSFEYLPPATTTTTRKPFIFTTRAQVFYQPEYTQAPQYQPPQPVYDYQTEPAPVYQPEPSPVYQPEPAYDYQPEPAPALKAERPQYYQQESHEKPYGIPRPAIPPAPELNILPYDQLPQGAELQNYLYGVFNDFMVKYQREYIDVPGEREYRFGVFQDSFFEMNDNARTDPNGKYSVTEFSDLTSDEFGRILGFVGTDESFANLTVANTTIASGDVPEDYDERDDNLVTRVRLQGDCGACWAFTTVVAIEGLCAKRTKKLQEFSEQSLLDCDGKNLGCKGGTSPTAIKHIVKRGGLELEAAYPYVFSKSSCKFNPRNVRVKVAEAINFKKRDEEGMKNWLFQNGPVIVSINAKPLKYYKGGIMNPTPTMCNPKKVDHNVALIGYGVDVDKTTGEKLPYWIAKNSWGSRWGEKGFFRIARNKNACGLALWASSARLADVPNNCLLPNGK